MFYFRYHLFTTGKGDRLEVTVYMANSKKTITSWVMTENADSRLPWNQATVDLRAAFYNEDYQVVFMSRDDIHCLLRDICCLSCDHVYCLLCDIRCISCDNVYYLLWHLLHAMWWYLLPTVWQLDHGMWRLLFAVDQVHCHAQWPEDQWCHRGGRHPGTGETVHQ